MFKESLKLVEPGRDVWRVSALYNADRREANRFETDKIVCIDMQNPYYRMLHSGWGQKLREVFDSLDDPVWDDAHTDIPLRVEGSGGRSKPLKKITRPEEKLI